MRRHNGPPHTSVPHIQIIHHKALRTTQSASSMDIAHLIYPVASGDQTIVRPKPTPWTSLPPIRPAPLSGTSYSYPYPACPSECRVRAPTDPQTTDPSHAARRPPTIPGPNHV
ncbi:hypothetical protein OH77DRAFT_855707 [Trametes cingulata]|nr:hypothetical protein OH77DRAFT_855707 [Trametes cingulata]